MLEVKARVTERGTKSFELATLFGKIEQEPGGPSVGELSPFTAGNLLSGRRPHLKADSPAEARGRSPADRPLRRRNTSKTTLKSPSVEQWH